MIYGFAMAVIAGFLLTAVKNWTGIATIEGKPLMALFSLWLVARVLMIVGNDATIMIAAIFDLLFMFGLLLAVLIPIVKVKQWKQLAIVSKLGLLFFTHLAFYLGALGILEQGVMWGVYGGLYLIVSLILTMGRRVLPFFIEMGVDEDVQLKNSKWIDISSLVLFLGFFINELFFTQPALSAYLALALFAVNAVRLIGWHTKGIWSKSLLWSIYLAFWLICIGFLLFSLAYFFDLSYYLAIHAFAVGGVGLVTLAMMARVSLGHTGRNVKMPPKSMSIAFVLLLLSAVVRVFFPLIDIMHYVWWVGLSQLFWIVAFLIFSWVYFPMFNKPRIDGQAG